MLAQERDVCRECQNVPQRGGALGALLGHVLREAAIAWRDVERVDGFGRQLVEAGVDVAGFVDAERVAHFAERHQPHGVGRFCRLVVGKSDLLFREVDKPADRSDAVGVARTFAALLKEPEDRDVGVFFHRQRTRMPVGRGTGDDVEANAAHRAHHVGEVALQDGIIGVEEVGLEELTARVAFDGTKPDLAHRLHQRLFGRFDELLVGRSGIVRIKLLGAKPDSERVNGGGAKPQRAGDVVRRGDLAAFDNQRDLEAQSLFDEALVHCRDGERHRHGSPGTGSMPVADDDDTALVARAVLNLGAQGGDRVDERPRVGRCVVQIGLEQRLEGGPRTDILRLDLQHVRHGEDRRGQHDLLCARRAATRFGAKGHPQRHAVGFAD